MISEVQAQQLVDSNLAEWDGWTLVIYGPGDGWASTKGLHRNGKWLLGHRFDIQLNGCWNVPKKLLK